MKITFDLWYVCVTLVGLLITAWGFARTLINLTAWAFSTLHFMHSIHVHGFYGPEWVMHCNAGYMCST